MRYVSTTLKKKIPRKYFRDKQIELFEALVKWDFDPLVLSKNSNKPETKLNAGARLAEFKTLFEVKIC